MFYRNMALVAVLFLFWGHGFAGTYSLEAQQRAMELWRLITMDHDQFLREGHIPIKCATGVVRVLREDFDELPWTFQQDFLSQTMAKSAAVLDEVYTTASGKFTIHFVRTGRDSVPSRDQLTLSNRAFLTGANGIPDYVEYVAESCDSVFSYITGTLGYNYAYPRVGVCMRDLGNVYGYAYTEDSIAIDNDLDFLSKQGLDVRGGYGVTVAHEFFHMVQFGYTTYFNFFNEPSSVWMEDKVYPEVNDYLQYIDTAAASTYHHPEYNIMTSPDRPLDGFNPDMPGNYDKVVWPKFLDERFSPEVIRYAWEEYGQGMTSTGEVFTHALQHYDSAFTFVKAFAEFGVWLYYTGTRSGLKQQVFTDAALWPLVRTDYLSYQDFVVQATKGIRPLSLQYWALGNRDRHEIGVHAANGEGSVSLYTAGISGASVDDSLLVLASPVIDIDWWAGRTFPSELLAVQNADSALITLRLLQLDSVYQFIAGETITQNALSGVSGSITILDSFVCILKDSTGSSDTPDRALFEQIYNVTGMVWQMDPDAYAPLHPLSVFKVTVDSVLDRMAEQGVLSLRFNFVDSSNYYFNYQIFTAASRTGPSRAVTRGENNVFFVAYDSVRGSMTHDDTSQGRACKSFLVYSAGLSGIGSTVHVFPNPISRDQARLTIVCDSLFATGACRIYSLSGSLVRMLDSGRQGEFIRMYEPGNTGGSRALFFWDLKNRANRRIDPGIYFYYVSGRSLEGGPIGAKAGKVAVVKARNP
ncbi:MAG: hypothetical protein A2519_19155 [Candidatus Raymondbacteria bacterium RIFOXYD12_FULL_49_13]|uniref:Uncharacterized protein n=1 Tax=Candidatus Raymondbacteria bacterium RIFOXYD12_FULL_49_13 TaxID=1817890 RepID=A0A1F7F4K7_UNCRA|nr:MAG: hypothetical protein A2519_19155 [Candidatus Raymondbacteria bacterium RIFOXYD12_FULL_49_13]